MFYLQGPPISTPIQADFMFGCLLITFTSLFYYYYLFLASYGSIYDYYMYIVRYRESRKKITGIVSLSEFVGFCLFVCLLACVNAPVNNFSVMSGRSHRFLDISSTVGE